MGSDLWEGGRAGETDRSPAAAVQVQVEVIPAVRLMGFRAARCLHDCANESFIHILA